MLVSTGHTTDLGHSEFSRGNLVHTFIATLSIKVTSTAVCMCVLVRVHACTYRCTHAWVQMPMWRPEATVKCLPWSHSTLVFEAGSLPEPGALAPRWTRAPVVFLSFFSPLIICLSVIRQGLLLNLKFAGLSRLTASKPLCPSCLPFSRAGITRTCHNA